MIKTAPERGECDGILDDYKRKHQLAIDEHFARLRQVCGYQLSGDDENDPNFAKNREGILSANREGVIDHANKLMAEGVVFPEDAFFLLTGIDGDAAHVGARLRQKNLHGAENTPLDEIHLWDMAALVLQHEEPGLFAGHSYSDLEAEFAQTVDGIDGWADYYPELARELNKRIALGQDER